MSETAPLRIGIAIPAYGSTLDVGHAAMWFGLGAAFAASTDKFELVSFTEYHINGIDLCRNTAVYDAMQAGCDWVFMIDADTFHQSARQSGAARGAAVSSDAIADAGMQILQMIRDAQRGATAHEVAEGEYVVEPIEGLPPRSRVALVGAPVRGRGVGDNGVCVQRLKSAPSPDEPGIDYWCNGEPMPLEELAGKVIPVGRIGGACIAINCDWLRRFWPNGPWFVMEHDYSGRPKNARGEDYWICDGIWKRGGVVLCDGRFVPAHVDRRKLVGE